MKKSLIIAGIFLASATVLNAQDNNKKENQTQIEYKLKEGKMSKGVVKVYKAIENGVVGAYKWIENGVVNGYQKVEDAFVDTFLEEVETDKVNKENETK